MDEIDTILESYHVGVLAEMAEAALVPVRDGIGSRLDKRELKNRMRDRFFTRERVLASLTRLDDRARAVLNRLLLRGGTASTRVLQHEALRARLATPPRPGPDPRFPYGHSNVPYARDEYAGDPRRDASAVFEDVVARLTLHGIVFSRYGANETWPGAPPKLRFHPAGVLYIPQAILRHLPPPQPVQEPAAREPATVRQGEPGLLLRDLYLYWDYARRNEVPLLKAGLVSKRTLRAINATLIEPDPLLEEARSEADTRRLALLGGLAEALGLLRAQSGCLRPAGGDALHIPAFWGRSETEQLAACLEVWPRLTNTAELAKGAGTPAPQYAHARTALLETIKAQPARGWSEVAELVETMQAQDISFLFAEHGRVAASRDTYYYGYNDGLYGTRTSLLKMLERLEGEFVEACLTGFLCQVGLVELGYEGGRLVSFRLTPAGRTMLGSAGPQSAQAGEGEAGQGRIVAQPNFQILALGPVSLATLARLDLFAERVRADRGAFEYRLSRESVYGAQQLGLEVAQITAFLSEASAVELPQNVRRSLEEWAAHHERIVFRSGVSLLQAATPSLLDELMAAPGTHRLLARQVAPEVALLAHDNQEALVATLVRRGLFPAVSGADVQSADHSVVVRDDGTIRPIHTVPSLHLRGRLARLAEDADHDGTWKLTPASVRRAAGNKARVLRLLEELGSLQRGALPAGLVEQIKSWGGYYGDAAVQALTLIEFRDGAALEELRQRPELRELLMAFPAGDRALAVVPGERLAELKGLLGRLGVRVREGL